MFLCLRTDRGTACQSGAEAAMAVHSSHPCTALQGMQELHKAAPQTAGGEADPETQQAVQRVFNLVRNGTSGSAAKDCNLTLDDVVRFYNVSVTPAHCAMDSCTMARAWYFTLNHQHTQRAAIFMHNQDVCEDLEKDDSAGVGARAGCCSVAS